MKTLILAFLLIAAPAFAQVPSVISIGRGNVESGGTEYLKGLWLKKRDGTLLAAKCDGGIFESPSMILSINGKTVAKGKVKDCVNVLREIYRVAFEKREQYTIALSDKTDSKGLRGLTLTYSKSL